MKTLLIILLSTSLVVAQKPTRYLLDQTATINDTLQDARIDAMWIKMKAMEVMTKAVNAADSLLNIKVTRMASVNRSGTLSVTVAAGATKIYIPHGLGYKPASFFAHVLKPGGTGNAEVDADAINMIVTLPTAPLLPTTYLIYWTFSNTP